MSKEAEASLLLRIKQTGSEILDHVVITLGEIVEAAKKVVEALMEPVNAYKRQEEAVNSLNQSLITQGIYTAELSQNYQEMAMAMSRKSKFDDEEIIAAQAKMQAYLGQIPITQELMQATIDFAARNGDLAGSADKVAKTIAGQNNMLKRNQIEIDMGASTMQRMDEVVQKLNGHFHDAAEAQTRGLGSMDMVRKAYEDVMKVIGKELAPTFIAASKAVVDFLDELSESQTFIDSVKDGITFLTKVVFTTINAFDNLGTSIGAIFGTVAGAIDQAVHGKFKEAMDTMRAGNDAANQEIADNNQALADRLKQLDDDKLAAKQEMLQKESDMEKEAEVQREARIQERLANMDIHSVDELAKTQALNDALTQQQIIKINEELMHVQDRNQRAQLEANKAFIMEQSIKKQKDDLMWNSHNLEQMLQSQRVQKLEGTLGTISSLQSSHNGAMMVLGKAAAIAQITISTARGVMQAWELGPILGPILAPIVIAAGAAQAANVAGVALADGGIVSARPGGIQATIGEGGKDEAVIPLDSDNAMSRLGGMGGMTVNFNYSGPVLGDHAQAMEHARIVDRALLQLRKEGESVSFDRLT